MELPRQALGTLRPLSEEELRGWEEAYAAVEAYLLALRVRNRLLLADLVRGILWRASARHGREPGRSPRELAMEETLGEIARWTHEVLQEDQPPGVLSVHGRLGLLLADMPGRWQGAFLAPPPWPEAFVESMRKRYLSAGPSFHHLEMESQPLELNAFGSGAARWSALLERRPLLRLAMAAMLALVLAGLGWSIFLN